VLDSKIEERFLESQERYSYFVSTPVPSPSPPPTPAGYSLEIDPLVTTNKFLRFKGTIDTRPLTGSAEIPILTSGMESGGNYYIAFRHKVDQVKCYNSMVYPDHRANASRADLKEIFCGYPAVYLIIRKNGSSWRKLRLTYIPRWDGAYTAHISRPWANEMINFYLPKVTTMSQVSLALSVEMNGFDGEFYIDDVSIQKPSNGFDPQFDGGEFSYGSSQYEFPGVKIVRASPKCSTVTSINSNITVDTENVSFAFNGRDEVVTSRNGKLLGKITFPSSTFTGLTIRKKPQDADMAGAVELSNQKITFKVGADGVLLAKLREPLSFDVTGNPLNKSDQQCPNCYKDFYFNQEAGTVFEVKMPEAEGFFFSPVYPPQSSIELSSAAYTTAGSGGPSFSDNYGDWRYNETYLRGTLERDNWEVVNAQGNWTESPSGPKAPIVPWQIRYNLKKYDLFILSAMPITENSPLTMCSERVQNTLKIDPKAAESTSNNLTTHIDAIRSAPNYMNNEFWNWSRYSRANNIDLPTEYYVHRTGPGALGIEEYIPPFANAPFCSDVTSYPVDCKEPYKSGADIHGPWIVSPEDMTNVVSYMQRVSSPRSNVPNDITQPPLLYIGTQFFYTRNSKEALQNLNELWSQYSPFGLGGFYFDGPPNEPIKALEFLRGVRSIIGSDGTIVLHYSKDNTFLPQTDHYFVPAYVAHANSRVLAEGVKKTWDFDEQKVSNGIRPEVWALMYGGAGTRPSALFPELRPLDYSKTDPELVAGSIKPRLQAEAQFLSGGFIFGQTSEFISYSFSDKWRPEAKACYPTAAPFGACANDGQPGYWLRLNTYCGGN